MKRPVVPLVILIFLLLLLLTRGAGAQVGGDLDLTWSTVDGGGATWSSGGAFSLGGTAGQPDAGPLIGGAFRMVQSGFWHDDNSPTAVRLARFEARPAGTGIRVEWETASEVDNVGFHLYRSTSLDSLGERLNEALIPSQAPGQGLGALYTFYDESAAPGVAYYYTLEDVNLDGQVTPHGPVQIQLARVYLPLQLP